MIASNDLVEAFESIGLEGRSSYTKVNKIPGFTLEKLRNWLFKEKGLFVEVNHKLESSFNEWQFSYRITDMNFNKHIVPHHSRSDYNEVFEEGLMKAVEILKGVRL